MTNGGGYSIFHDTMADMTYLEVEQAARDGAVVLWSLGVIEQHGPHLPLATDIYVPAGILSQARGLLRERGVPSIIAPPFYWGINVASASFAGSFEVRPDVMVELMKDVIANLKKDGFEQVFCISGHGEALHNQTILRGLKAATTATPIAAGFLIEAAMAKRLGFALDDPQLALLPPESAGPPEPYLDIHAGAWETSVIWGLYPEVVRSEVIPTLPPTNYGPSDLAEWRKGFEHSRRKTPAGYFGQPAAADPATGGPIVAEQARRVAEAICAKLAVR